MSLQAGIADSVRRRYHAKITALLVIVAVLTLSIGFLFAAHVLYGTYGTVEERAISAITALLVVFVVHVAVVGLVVGGNVGLPLRHLREKTDRIGEGEFDVALETDRIDEVGRLYDGVAEMRDSLEETLAELETERSNARDAQQTAEERSERLVSEAEQFSAVMACCADGDLTGRLAPETGIDALDDIAVAFNDMIEQLEEIVGQGQTVSRFVDETSTQLQQSASEITAANQEVSSNIQDISDGSSRQTHQLENAATEVRSLSASTQEVASATSDIAGQSIQVSSLAEDGKTAIGTAAADIEASIEQTDALGSTIRTLESEAERIEDVIGSIREISQQINMLALNAAIEASRAAAGGSNDDGFDAVADEVKALSQETQTAIDEIEEVLASIRDRATEGAVEIDDVDERIRATQARIEAVESTFATIADGITTVDDGVQQIDTATTHQASSAEEIATIVESVAEVSAETTAQSQEVAAAAEQTAVTAEGVSRRAQSLDREAQHLATMMDLFEVTDLPTMEWTIDTETTPTPGGDD